MQGGLLSPRGHKGQSLPGPSTPRLRSFPQHFRFRNEQIMKWFMFAVFLCGLLLLTYALRGLKRERVCTPSWASHPPGTHLNIAIVTFSNEALQIKQKDEQQEVVQWQRGRNFEGVLSLTRDNKVQYARKHSYDYIDASWIVSDERPPSWSKILAAKHYLKDHDWVMWLDADTIVTNPEIRLESLLPRSTNGPDFVITVDGGGYNAGIWLLRSTPWSYTFLDRWWNMKHYITVRMKHYITAPGKSTKSGDNDALKELLDDERRHGRHIGIAPQCSFNSYVWRSRIRDWWRLVYMPNTILMGLHRPGDFILHLAGIDDKRVYLEHALEEANAQWTQGPKHKPAAQGRKLVV